MIRDKIALLFIKTELERVARAIVKALQVSTFKVKITNPEVRVSNLPKNQPVTVSNQIKLDQTVSVLRQLIQEVKALKTELKPKGTVRVDNLKEIPQVKIPEYPKFPEFPDLPELDTYEIENLLEEAIKELKELPSKIKIPKTVIPPFPKIPEVKIPKYPGSMRIDNLSELIQALQSSDAKKYIPVRLTDGKKFYQALEDLRVATTSGESKPFFLPNGSKTQAALNEDSEQKVEITNWEDMPAIEIPPITIGDVEIDATGLAQEVTLQAILAKINVHVDNETPGGTVDGANKDFTLAYNYKNGTTKIFVNGVRQREGVGNDYFENGTNEIEFTVAPIVGDTLIADYIKA